VNSEVSGCSARVSLALLVACALACEDPLTDPAVVAGPRIVGARVSAMGDAELAQPRAGQAANIEWLVLSDREGSFSARVAACNSAPSVLGAPSCAGPSFTEQSVTGRFGEPLSFAFGVPAELAPGEAWLVWLGLCRGDESPAFSASASAFSCPSGEAVSGFYRGFVPEGTPNRNPSLADDLLRLDGAPWTALAALPVRGTCRDAGLPALHAGLVASVSFELGGDDRDPLEVAPGTYAAHDRESLVYTHLASHAGLERAFSAIDYDERTPSFEVPFEPLAEPPGEAGETLDFYLFVRDERGGVDWLRRQACLLP
jgi:hypothetical protein